VGRLYRHLCQEIYEMNMTIFQQKPKPR
jgi:hypothetical protein